MGKKTAGELNGVAKLFEMRQAAEQNVAPSDEVFREKYPHLFSILTDNRISETQVFDGCSMTIRNSTGDWAISLSAGGLRMYGTILARTIEEGLAEANLRLGNTTFPWKVDQRKRVNVRELKKQK